MSISLLVCVHSDCPLSVLTEALRKMEIGEFLYMGPWLGKGLKDDLKLD